MSEVIDLGLLALIGPSGVGKTAFVNRHKTGAYTQNYDCTHGHEDHILAFRTNDKKIVKFTVRDTSGCEEVNAEYGYTIPTALVGNRTDLQGRLFRQSVNFHQGKDNIIWSILRFRSKTWKTLRLLFSSLLASCSRMTSFFLSRMSLRATIE